MDRIEKDKSDVEDCMMHLVEDWVCNKDGTGERPRTWTTVVQVLKEMKVPLPEQLEEQYGQWLESIIRVYVESNAYNVCICV